MRREAPGENPISWEMRFTKDQYAPTKVALDVLKNYTLGDTGIGVVDNADSQQLLVRYENVSLQNPKHLDRRHAWHRFKLLQQAAEREFPDIRRRESAASEAAQLLLLRERLIGFAHAKDLDKP